MVPQHTATYKGSKLSFQKINRGMKFGNANGLRTKQFKVIVFAFFMIFIIWKWEKGTQYTAYILRSDSVSMLYPVNSGPEDNQAPDEDFPNPDSSRPLTEVGEQTLSASPPPSILVSSSDGTNGEGNSALEKGCNYAKGKWVDDDSRPLYSGFGCKQWLAEGWACRLTQRKDFAYEKYRWQPEGCDVLEFEGSEFLRRMRGKTIAYVGDSLGRQMFQSMMCMVTAGKHRQDVQDIGSDYGFFTEPGAKRPNGWAYRFPSTNTTILYYWSSTLCDLEPLEPSNPATSYAMHLDRPPAFLKDNLHRFGVLVLNTGHHWNRGKLKSKRWEMYLAGVPNTDKNTAVMWKAKNLTIHSVVKWLDSQLPQHPHLKVFYRSISPRHFFNGDWNTGGSCDNTSPLAGGNVVSQNHSEDADAEGAVRGTRIRLLDVTALSRLRDEGHISRYSIKGDQGIQDCLHWCLPGVPDTWNEILAAQLQDASREHLSRDDSW